MRSLFKNPVFITVLLTSLMALPFIVLLLDRYLLGIDNPMLFLAEVGIITLGVGSGVLIFYFLLRK